MDWNGSSLWSSEFATPYENDVFGRRRNTFMALYAAVYDLEDQGLNPESPADKFQFCME